MTIMSDENKPITELIPDYDSEQYGFDVPAMPPIDNKMASDSHQGNWLWVHYDSTNHEYRSKTLLRRSLSRQSQGH